MRVGEFYRLLQGQVIDDARLFTEKLQEWEDYYNYHPPSRRFRRPNTLRTTTPQNSRPTVIGLRQLHNTLQLSIGPATSDE